MRIEPTVVQSLAKEASRFQLAAVTPADCGRVDVDAELNALRERLAERIEAHLQPWFVLLDESIQFFIQFERYLYEVALSSRIAAFAVTVSKIKRDVISIRGLLATGQDVSAQIIARAFIEDTEIAMALALDPRTCDAFSDTGDTNEFWNKHIGYGKVYDQVHQYLLGCGVAEDRAKLHVDHHRAAKRMFSESTHGGLRASVFSAFAPSLTDRDQVHHLSLGALTHLTAQLALFVAKESSVFASSVTKGPIVPKPLHLFRDFCITGRYLNAVESAYVLQELLVGYEDQLEEELSKFQYGTVSGEDFEGAGL